MNQIMNRRQKTEYSFFVLLWAVANIFFWSWWLQPNHFGNPILFFLLSIAFFYDVTVLPSFYLFFLGQMKKPKAKTPFDALPKIKKVAMITLTVPGSENLEIVKRQLRAMSQVKFPHDSWILVDKIHSEEIKKLASLYGVKYFSRHDKEKFGQEKIDKWNQQVPPFQEKTKAGNVNAWIEAYGSKYSHFTQLDIDHIPNSNYLDKVLGHFSDSKVAWVQAPSVYGNFGHWTARGSSELELVLQGPLQMGFYGFSQTPFIIGSHCTYNMSAIKEIGGFQPTRAEDHLDTVYLAAHGYQGVFLPEIIATGDGPENFEMFLKQQFAWAYSMIQVLFSYTPVLIKNYNPKQLVQFVFVQTWYPLFALSMLILFSLPILSLLTNQPISTTKFGDFFIYSTPLATLAFSFWFWSRKWQFPKSIELSWRGIVLHMARWAIVLQALIQVIFNIKKPYMITVKGISDERPYYWGSLVPYLALSTIALLACVFYNLFYISGPEQGYLLFALEGSALLLTVCLITLGTETRELLQKNKNFSQLLMLRKAPIVVLTTACLFWIATTASSAAKIFQAINSDNKIFEEANFTPQINTLLKGELIANAQVIKFPISNSKTVTKLPDQNDKESNSDKVNLHKVVSGENLWLISQKYYGTGIEWQKIRDANPDKIDYYARSGKFVIHPDIELIIP